MAFKLFSPLHLGLVLGVFFVFLGFHIYQNKLYKLSDKTKRIISLILITILFLNMTIYYGMKLVYGRYDWRVNLPLHFCFITGYLFMFAILFKKKQLYKNIYFWTFIGPIPGLLLPGMRSSFDSFLFYQQVISHNFLLISSLFIFYAYNIRITKKDMMTSALWASLVFGLVYIFNNIFNTNYIMQTQLPEQVLRVFPFLSDLQNPIAILFVTAITILFVAYIPIYLRNKKQVKSGLHLEESLL